MEEFNRVYHHKIWQGNHVMSLIPDKPMVVDTPTGPRQMWKPGLTVKFTRGTYHCKDPRIATLIERHREFQVGTIIKLPPTEEFTKAAGVSKMATRMLNNPDGMAQDLNQRLDIPKQEVVQPVAQEQRQPDPQVAQLTEVVGQLMAEIKSLKAEKVLPREDPPTLQEPEYQPPASVPEQPQEYPEPLDEMPSGVDGDIPIPTRQPPEQDQGPPRDLGTPRPLNANAVGPDGQFVRNMKEIIRPDGTKVMVPDGTVPPGGDGVIKPSAAAMERSAESGMPDIERIVREGRPLPDGWDSGVEAFSGKTPPPQASPELQRMAKGGVSHEIPETNRAGQPSEVPADPIRPPEMPGVPEVPQEVPEPATPDGYIDDPKALLQEAKTIAKITKMAQPQEKPKTVDGKRALYCKICGKGPYTGGRSIATHRQSDHPEMYASKKKKK